MSSVPSPAQSLRTLDTPEYAANQRHVRIALLQKHRQKLDQLLGLLNAGATNLPDGVTLASINKGIEINCVQMRLELAMNSQATTAGEVEEIPQNVEPRSILKLYKFKREPKVKPKSKTPKKTKSKAG